MNSACSVSGVVMRRSGGDNACFLRSAFFVSPCLTPTDIPSSPHHQESRWSISRFRERSGVM